MLLLLVALAVSVQAQQLQGQRLPMPYDLSASCLKALNTSVSCPGGLMDLAQRFVRRAFSMSLHLR